jgi:hypothetical protein
MGKVEYKEYLASREWALKREAVRKRCGNVCERCHKAPHENTHHVTYARVGNERLEDLLGVCRKCHEFLSGKSDVDPASKPKQVNHLSNKTIIVAAYERVKGRLDRLERVVNSLDNLRFSGWLPYLLYDEKGKLIVYSFNTPNIRERLLLTKVWEEECEYDIEFVTPIEGDFDAVYVFSKAEDFTETAPYDHIPIKRVLQLPLSVFDLLEDAL